MEQNNHSESPLFNLKLLGKWWIIIVAVLTFFIVFPVMWVVLWYLLPWALVGVLIFAFVYYGVADKLKGQIPNAYPTISLVLKEVVLVFKKYIYRFIFFTIAGLIVGCSGVFLYQYFNKETVTISKLNRISVAIEKYNYETGHYPASLNELIAGSPIRKEWRSDVWGNPIFYQLGTNSGSYQLISPGKDGLLGSDDDIIFK